MPQREKKKRGRTQEVLLNGSKRKLELTSESLTVLPGGEGSVHFVQRMEERHISVLEMGRRKESYYFGGRQPKNLKTLKILQHKKKKSHRLERKGADLAGHLTISLGIHYWSYTVLGKKIKGR